MLLRIGLAKRFELRVGADGFVTDSVRPDGQPSQRTSGFSAVALAGKYVLRESDDGLALAVIPILAIPTGSDAFGGSVDPAVKLTWAHGLPAVSTCPGTSTSHLSHTTATETSCA